MKKQEIHPELQEFKELLMKFNQKKSNVAYNLMVHLGNKNGFIWTELNKLGDFDKMGGLGSKEGNAFVDGLHKLSLLLDPILGIKIMSRNGRDYEKHVNLLVKRINSLPDNYRDGVLEQIKGFVLSDENQSVTYEFLKAQLDYIESLGDPEYIRNRNNDDLIISDGRK